MLDIREVRLSPGFRTQKRIGPKNQLNSRRREPQIHQSAAEVDHSPLCRSMDTVSKFAVAVDVFVKCDSSHSEDDGSAERALGVSDGFLHRLDSFVA